MKHIKKSKVNTILLILIINLSITHIQVNIMDLNGNTNKSNLIHKEPGSLNNLEINKLEKNLINTTEIIQDEDTQQINQMEDTEKIHYTASSAPLQSYQISSLNTSNFISIWDTSITKLGSTNSSQIKLPLESNGYYNFSVNWGDNSTDIITTWNQTEVVHTFPAGGIYYVTISGKISGWSFNNQGDAVKFIQIINWGMVNLGNNGFNFAGSKYLDITATDGPDLNYTTNLAYTFLNCNTIHHIGSVNAWNVSLVTNMSNILRMQDPLIKHWIHGMFLQSLI